MYIFYALASLVGAFALFAATRPPAFSITRSRTLAAPPAALFALVNDFHEWGKWSPWEKLDPTMTRTFDGPAAGVGANYAWSGNAKAGAGTMTIRESVPSSRIALDLKFLKPFPADNTTVFTFEPDGAGTRVTWTMAGNNGFVARAFNVVANVDKMVGGAFEQGLAALETAGQQA